MVIRAERFKAFLRDYMLSKAYQGGKIVVVGHKTMFQFMTATEWETIPLEHSS